MSSEMYEIMGVCIKKENKAILIKITKATTIFSSISSSALSDFLSSGALFIKRESKVNML